ncbi:MAG TPA: aspartate carbamoyltransferase regulatory subunit [Nitrososphaerales archaeon]|nr:aspartate carbamoyltransferase regulatory subunit [Nitrososphaerales archaeon]
MGIVVTRKAPPPESDNQTQMLVRKIPDGSVIDHVAAGKALSVLRLLGNPQEKGLVIALVMNVSSSKMGRKDIVKVEGMEISPEQIQRLALIAPRASVNIVRAYKVVAKKNAVPPRTLHGILSCTAPTCVSVREKDSAPSIFFISGRSPLRYRCKYCGRELSEKEISQQLG